MRERERAESLRYEICVIKNLMSLLCDHFETKRYEKDVHMDWYSLQYKFTEYMELSYVILKKLNDTEESIKDLIDELYKTEKKGEN